MRGVIFLIVYLTRRWFWLPLKQKLRHIKKCNVTWIAKHLGKWVVVHDKQLIGVYESLQNAGVDAITKFDRGPYLIHQVGKPFEIQLPAKFHGRT